MGYDPSQTTWLNPAIEYLFGDNIIEYDIRDAGFSLIKEFRLLPQYEIDRLERIPKGKERHIAIGCMERDDKELARRMSEKFAEARRVFIDVNSIDSANNIISVKKDAIFVIDAIKKTKFGHVEFVDKHHYTSYIRLPSINNVEMYYNNAGIDLKGIGDIPASRHRIYMLEWLRKYFDKMEIKDPTIKRFMMKFMMDYKQGLLDQQFYLEFNNMSRDYDKLHNWKNLIVPLVDIIKREIQ